VTDILTNDEISLLRSLEKKSRTITGNFTHKRYDRLETKGYIKRSSQPPSMQDILYEITDAGKAALRAVGGASEWNKNENGLARANPALFGFGSRSKLVKWLKFLPWKVAHVGLELRNVGANYPFERSHRFPVIQPNSGNGDCSRFELRLQLGH
jgi:hypothetical protein